VPRPPTGETPGRHVRIADTIWNEVRQIADEEERTVTGIVVEALTRWLSWHKRKSKHRAAP
jgi:hypothetical protein